ncbi:hypothetical protein KFL_000310340 [Klebsormidium nitens]|uniref:BZIP domain-containing protein n=1 Tax=Klebsormidium nitens TaxID=105231 RepID=A0A1Y1HLJ8_KLENI|nr:hypothetical protein KFL_000310340 [Klebsormidium nitens]|eukprot:GAQ79484.1 hypothetical protein KFL_000310340 [Klebsormidium nitens]
MFSGSDDDGLQQGSFLWNGDTDLDLMEDPELVSLFDNLPDTEMSLADAMQFTDSSLSDAAARSHFVYLPEESQHGLGDALDMQAGGQGARGGEGFAQLREVAGFGQDTGEQAVEGASGQASLDNLFPKVDDGTEPDIPALFEGWQFVDTDTRGAPGPWRPPDPDELGNIQPRSEDDSDSMNGDEQPKPPPAFLGSSQRRPPLSSPTEITRQGVSQLQIHRSNSAPRNPPPPLTAPIVPRGSGLLNPGGVFTNNPGGAPRPLRGVGPGQLGVMVTANGSVEGGPFGPAGRGALGVRKGVAKNEKNALKSRRHRARKKEQERTLERRVGELENDNQALKSQLDQVRAEKDALQRRLEEDGRRAVREVQDENDALRRDLALVQRAMEDLVNDRAAGGRVDRQRGGDASEGG